MSLVPCGVPGIHLAILSSSILPSLRRPWKSHSVSAQQKYAARAYAPKSEKCLEQTLEASVYGARIDRGSPDHVEHDLDHENYRLGLTFSDLVFADQPVRSSYSTLLSALRSAGLYVLTATVGERYAFL